MCFLPGRTSHPHSHFKIVNIYLFLLILTRGITLNAEFIRFNPGNPENHLNSSRKTTSKLFLFRKSEYLLEDMIFLICPSFLCLFLVKIPSKVRSHLCGCDQPKNPSTHALRTHNFKEATHLFAPQIPHARVRPHARTHVNALF